MLRDYLKKDKMPRAGSRTGMYSQAEVDLIVKEMQEKVKEKDDTIKNMTVLGGMSVEQFSCATLVIIAGSEQLSNFIFKTTSSFRFSARRLTLLFRA